MPSSACKKCRSEEHTSELQSHDNLVCRLLLEKKERARRRQGRAPLCGLRGRGRRAGRAVPAGGGGAIDAGEAHVRLPEDDPFFFFNDPATPEISSLSQHDALPI